MEKKLDPKMKLVWLTRNGLIALILLIQLISVLLFNLNYLPILIISLGIPELILIALLLIWPFLMYKNYSFSYDNDTITIKHGVLFRHTILVPIIQIQDLHTYQGPILMAFHLSGIIISTAGSNHSIAGLPSADSETLVLDFERKLIKRVEEKEI